MYHSTYLHYDDLMLQRQSDEYEDSFSFGAVGSFSDEDDYDAYNYDYEEDQ